MSEEKRNRILKAIGEALEARGEGFAEYAPAWIPGKA